MLRFLCTQRKHTGWQCCSLLLSQPLFSLLALTRRLHRVAFITTNTAPCYLFLHTASSSEKMHTISLFHSIVSSAYAKKQKKKNCLHRLFAAARHFVPLCLVILLDVEVENWVPGSSGCDLSYFRLSISIFSVYPCFRCESMCVHS